jgi:hypothetical protein
LILRPSASINIAGLTLAGRHGVSSPVVSHRRQSSSSVIMDSPKRLPARRERIHFLKTVVTLRNEYILHYVIIIWGRKKASHSHAHHKNKPANRAE